MTVEAMQTMTLKLRVWRQANAAAPGRLVEYTARNIAPDISFLELLDVVNNDLVRQGEDPIAFDSDCREGICGSCSMVIGGIAHGPQPATTACQLFMRHFKDGDTVTVEPWRAKAFPILKDLVVDRSAFDRIQAAGGYVSVDTGSAPDANEILVGKDAADKAMDAAACIGCGACVAASGPAGARPPRSRHGRADGEGGLRPLLERRRVRGGVPEGDLGVAHPDAAPRVHPRLDQALVEFLTSAG